MIDAATFLSDWRQTHVNSIPRGPEALADAMTECLDDAAAKGFSRADLEKAAGGSLAKYLQEAIKKATRE